MQGNGDYISREAANEACRAAVRRYPNSFYNGIEAARDAIRKLPAADVRPVVLCRDCKYFSEVMYEGTQFEYGYCDGWADGTRINPEDFCSHAAKREDKT